MLDILLSTEDEVISSDERDAIDALIELDYHSTHHTHTQTYQSSREYICYLESC